MSKKRDRAEWARRLEGARLLRRGANLPEVTRRLKVSRKRQIGDPGSSIRPDVP
jgi:hypothetical protein